jgi:hypothetical protein
VIRLERVDCVELTSPGRSRLSLLVLLFFLARWSDHDALSFALGHRAI